MLCRRSIESLCLGALAEAKNADCVREVNVQISKTALDAIQSALLKPHRLLKNWVLQLLLLSH